MMIIENKYEIGDMVYLKTDPEQFPRVVIAFKVYLQGEMMYEIVAGTLQSLHYEFELSTEKDLINA